LSVVDSTIRTPIGLTLPVRMSVIRLPDNDLLLYSPTRLTEGLRAELRGLGRVRHLLAPNTVHWTFLPEWQHAYPDAITWAAPGLRERAQVRRSGARLDHDLGDDLPPPWPGIEHVVIPGGLGFREIALFHRKSRTLLMADLVLNVPARHVPAVVRPLARLLGAVDSNGAPAVYLRAVVALRRRDAAQAASQVLAWQPERVVFAHGDWFRQDGTASLRHALRWLLPAPA
jgi:hypothetical protein